MGPTGYLYHALPNPLYACTGYVFVETSVSKCEVNLAVFTTLSSATIASCMRLPAPILGDLVTYYPDISPLLTKLYQYPVDHFTV